MKKKPMHNYEKETGRKPFTAIMATEGKMRTISWLRNGCNAFDSKSQKSNPMAFWTEQDVLMYIDIYKIQIASIYGDIVKDNECVGQMSLEDYGIFDFKTMPTYRLTGVKRTGCMFCGYGCQMEKDGEGRFEKMKSSHPKQYEYIMKPWDDGGLGYKEVIDWINENSGVNIRY